MQRNGELPGIYAGNRFLINVDVLMEQLDTESRKAVKEDKNND